MPYRICKSFDIESGHVLSKHPDDCKFPHGHSRRVEYILEADTLNPSDMVCDFKLIRHLAGDFVERFDHAMCMNTADPNFTDMKARYGDRVIPFEDEDPTTEVIARVLYEAIDGRLDAFRKQPDAPYALTESVRVVKVRVWETSTSWAEYGR